MIVSVIVSKFKISGDVKGMEICFLLLFVLFSFLERFL